MYVIMLCLNGVFAYVDYVLPDMMKSPFDTTITINSVTQPKIFNNTNQAGTLYQNVTNVKNNTSNNPFNFFTESLFWSLGMLQNLYNFLGGGFLFSAISIIGIPQVFLASAFYSVLGFFIVITVVHLVTGRF